MKRVSFGAVAVLLALRAPAAQQPPDSVRRDTTGRRLETITIRAAASRAPLTTTVGGVSVVSIAPDSLRLSPAPALTDVLREMPFVLVRQNSRGESELSIRGSESRQSAVLLDRVPLTLGWDHRTDPSLVPMSGARSIAVVRGLSTLLQGPNVLAGVVSVDMNSGETDETLHTDVQLRSGADHTGALATSAAVVAPWFSSRGKLTLRAGGGFRSQDGFALSNRVDDPNADHNRRTNSDVEQIDGYLALRYTSVGGRWVGVSATGYQAERGVPPELHLSQPRLWRYPDASRLLAIASAGTGRQRTPFGSGDMEVVVGVNQGETEIENYESAAYTTIVGRERDKEHTFTTRLLADHSLGRGEIRTALTYANVRFREAIDADPVSRYAQRLWSAAAEVEQPVVGFLRASGGVAFDGSDTPETGGKPSLGRLSSWAGRFGLSTLAFGSTRLHASVSSRSRFAALRELYSGSLGIFEPNPDLRPERLLGFEGGATLIRSSAQLQGVLFHNRLRDAVVRVSTPAGQFRRINRDELRSTGVELLGTWTPGSVTWSGDLMLQHVRVRDPGAAGTDRRPEHVPELRAGMNVVFPVGLGARAALGADYTGVQYCVNPDVNRTERLGSTTRTNASVERDWQLRSEGRLSRLRTLIAVDNATDAALFTQCGLPDPGRTMRIGFVLR